MAVIAATRLPQPGMAWVILAHLLLPLLAWLATRATQGGIGAVLRGVYPVAILLGLYGALDILNGFGTAPVHDAAIQRLEAALFGMQPARDWWRSASSPFWSRVMHSVYLSYYLVVPTPLVVMAIRRQWEAMTHYLDGLIALFLCCYLFYILWPVAGPYYEFARPTGAFVANLPAELVYRGLARGSSFGAAFPSSHVAATLAAAIGGWHADRRLGAILMIPAVLLAIGVVYCQMHYAVDSLAGVLIGISIPWSVHHLQRTTPA
ncbi:MAG TPA: phosphatase PAP2 family protein [Gemmatimonadales bacterium]|nr:phosphatase PAP2 family protein [Gemmatimonadales bacterium]